VLIFILSLSQSIGLASHLLSATLLGWAWGRIRKKDELCICAERRVIQLSALLQAIRWARKARTKLKSTNACWAVHSRAKRDNTNKATYLSLKSNFGEDFGHFLKVASACERFLREKGSNPESFERFCCVKTCRRTELEEEVVLRAWDELWVIVTF